MQRKEMTLINYHVPEDRDRQEEPNVFSIPLHQSKLTLAHIQQYFPLKGTYTFRLKFPHDDLIVWLDLAGPKSSLPLFNGQVHVKASRLSWEDGKNNHSTPANVNKAAVGSNKKEPINLFDHHEESLTTSKETKGNEFAEMNLLDSHGTSPQPTHSDPSIKIDFFSSELPSPSHQQTQPQLQQGTSLSHHSPNGDLI